MRWPQRLLAAVNWWWWWVKKVVVAPGAAELQLQLQPRWCSALLLSARPKAIAGGFPGHRGDTEAGTEEEEEGGEMT